MNFTMRFCEDCLLLLLLDRVRGTKQSSLERKEVASPEYSGLQ